MAPINVTNVEVLDNPSFFTNPFQFQITFECGPPGVKEELEWKIVYVGSADDEKYDQTLDSVLVGPVQLGVNKFVFQADAPNPARIPSQNILDVTVVLLLGLYKDQEFIRVGYYVNNEIPGYNPVEAQSNPELPQLNPHEHIARVQRHILADQPRVTRHEIAWDDEDLQKRWLEQHQHEESQMGVQPDEGDAEEYVDEDDEDADHDVDDADSQDGDQMEDEQPSS